MTGGFRQAPEALAAQLRNDGFCVVPQALSPDRIDGLRDQVLRHRHLMGRTRRAAHSRHLAGFHRAPQLAEIEHEIANPPDVRNVLGRIFRSPSTTIGLSDITINRSQHWHTDLLRGDYAGFLDGIDPWAPHGGTCIKVLTYLQDGRSLRIVPGSHLQATPLDDRALEDLAGSRDNVRPPIRSGDIVLMDIRALHRGSSDTEMADPSLAESPKILVSTVLGDSGSAFCRAMRAGNRKRLEDWDRRHLGQPFCAP